jgi:hypothetical protein
MNILIHCFLAYLVSVHGCPVAVNVVTLSLVAMHRSI